MGAPKGRNGKGKMDTHPDRLQLEADVILKRKTKQEVADIVGCHYSSVTRYFQQLPEMRLREILAQDTLDRANEVTSILNDDKLDVSNAYSKLAMRVEAILTKAEQSDEPAFVLAAADGLRKVLRDIATLQGKMAQNLTVNVALADAPEWVVLRSILAKVIDEVPEAREPLLRHMRHEALSITKEGDRDAGL